MTLNHDWFLFVMWCVVAALDVFAMRQWWCTHRNLMRLIDAVTKDKQFDSRAWKVSTQILKS